MASSDPAAGYDLEPVLRMVARTTAASLGFRTCVINLHRRAWDDFETVAVHGSEEARRALLGQTSRREDWAALLDRRFERRGAYYIENGTFDWDQDGLASYIPPPAATAGPDAWDPEDALFVPLRSTVGEILGIMSVDEPRDGRRPDDEQLEVLVGMAQHAALALEHAQQAAVADRHRASVEHLLRVSAQLTERHTIEEMLDRVCVGIRDALGFQKVRLYMAEGHELVTGASVGWTGAERARFPRLPITAIAGVLDPAVGREGVVLLEREDAYARTDPSVHDIYASTRNGRGPYAWNCHWLLVPLRDREGRLAGAIWADDPEDRLLPTHERLQALKAFGNQAMSAMQSARQLELMRHLAEHDPLTGLRNRRGLQEHIDAEIRRAGASDSVALLVCDLDNFKRVNDVLGYETGDEALRRVAGVLRAIPAVGAVSARLGGEEFAIVLPNHDEGAAMVVAEAVRTSVRGAFEDFPWVLTTSVGVSVSRPDAGGAEALLRTGNRALFGAKRLGRDRCVAYHAETLDTLLGTLEDRGMAAGEQLSAAILLAETLDLRDLGTARHSQTVGRYAGDIARALGLPDAHVERVRAAGVLHDIGKLGVADAILKKPGPLSDEEWTEVKRHPELGARILEHANLRDISGWVLAHHERLDGGGYPNAAEEPDIPLEARILAVADAYEAMTADRVYRAALPSEEARAELRRHSGTQFDRHVVDAFLTVLGGAPELPPAPRSLVSRIRTG